MEETKKGFLSSLKGKVSAMTATVTAASFAMALPMLANTNEAKANKALENAGINTNASIADGSGSLMESMTGLVYVIMGVGALWAVAWVIIGGMLLAGSGSNPQKRTSGLAAIAVACVGIYVIYKAYTIAGWAAAL